MGLAAGGHGTQIAARSYKVAYVSHTPKEKGVPQGDALITIPKMLQPLNAFAL